MVKCIRSSSAIVELISVTSAGVLLEKKSRKILKIGLEKLCSTKSGYHVGERAVVQFIELLATWGMDSNFWRDFEKEIFKNTFFINVCRKNTPWRISWLGGRKKDIGKSILRVTSSILYHSLPTLGREKRTLDIVFGKPSTSTFVIVLFPGKILRCNCRRSVVQREQSVDNNLHDLTSWFFSSLPSWIV